MRLTACMVRGPVIRKAVHRMVMRSIHAGSWCEFPDGQLTGWRCSALLPAGEGVDDDHVPAAIRVWRTIIRLF